MSRMVKLLGAVVVALALVASASAAPPAGFYEAKRLAAPASFVARKPASINCAKDAASWHAWADPIYGNVPVNASSKPGSSEAYFSPIICRTLLAKLNKRAVNPYTFAASVLGLVHESIHLRGETNEGTTDCKAVHEMPRVLVTWFGVKPGAALRAVMAQAWRYRSTEPPAYRTAC